jgi:hypothetical protein
VPTAFFVLLSVERVLVRRVEMPAPARAVLPLAAGLFYMRSMVTDFRRQSDELQLRIYLEAAVVAATTRRSARPHGQHARPFPGRRSGLLTMAPALPRGAWRRSRKS